MPRQGQMVNEVHVKRVADFLIVRSRSISAVVVGLNLDVGPFAQVVPPPRQKIASRHRHGFVRDNLLGWCERSKAYRFPNPAFIDIALNCQVITASEIPICSKTHLSHSPAIEPLLIRMEPSSAAEALPVNPIVKVAAVAGTPTEPADALVNVSAANRSEGSMRVFRTLGNDVDHSGNRVRSPDRAPGAANDFDAFNILEQDAILKGPINAGEKLRIEASAVNHNQHGLRELVGKSAYAHCPMVVVNSTYLHTRNQPQNLRNTRGSGAADVLVRKYVDRRRSFPNLLGLFGRSCHFHVAQLGQAQLLQRFAGLLVWLRIGQALIGQAR